MAGLQADQQNKEFFKTFIPETIYLVEGDVELPSQETPASLTPEAKETPAAAPVSTAPEEATAKSQPAKNTPVLPKLPKEQAAKPAAKYKTLGGNNKGVIILVTLPEDQFERIPQLDFLNKILGAIGLQPTDVAYLNNISGAIAKFEDLQNELTVNYIISFASRLDTDLPHEKFTLYNPVNVGNVPVVFSQALAMLENDVEHKKQLWNALRQMFL